MKVSIIHIKYKCFSFVALLCVEAFAYWNSGKVDLSVFRKKAEEINVF